MKKPVKYRRQFWRWHRRIGLVSVVVLVILCVSGVVLNHSAHWRVDQLPVNSPLILKAYGIKAPEFSGLKVGEHWVTQVSNSLYWGQQVVGECEGELVGVWNPHDAAYWLAACQQELILFTHENELLEAINNSLGLPVPIVAIGECDKRLCMQVHDGALTDGDDLRQDLVAYEVDTDTLTWMPLASNQFSKAPLVRLPDSEQMAYRQLYTGQDLTWERVVLDIHAGRFLGAAGPWILDSFVIMFLFLSGSGFYLWYTARKNK